MATVVSSEATGWAKFSPAVRPWVTLVFYWRRTEQVVAPPPFNQMFAEFFLTFQSLGALSAVLALLALTAMIWALRRPDAPAMTVLLAGLGFLLLTLSAGDLTWERQPSRQVTVMVDLSPSTRTADYRDRALLERRIRQLLGDVPFRIQYFAAGPATVDPRAQRLPDLPAERTIYTPPGSPAALLFSDCRFELPKQSPPTYVVIDAGLEDVDDAALRGLEVQGDEVRAMVINSGASRHLVFGGTVPGPPATAPAGSIVVSRKLRSGASHVSAELNPGDAWPENDALASTPPPPDRLERWWVGGPGAGNGWTSMTPAQLLTDASAYLGVSVIVLENVDAGALSSLQQQRLRQYVRDLGGGLLILGGEHAFAAGGYPGTILEAMSPLASSPPHPTTHWILLADGSGSMAGDAAGATRWKYVTDAITQLLPHLPAQDLCSVGSFAERLDWWVQGQSVHEAAALALPPPGAGPHGPTNLQPALEAIARSVDGKMPVQLLVLSDFDTRITRPEELLAELKSKQIHLHLVAIDEGAALPVLRDISAGTGGSTVTQLDPQQWAQAAARLARSAAPKLLETSAINVTFGTDASSIGVQRALTWNRTWLKETALELARGRRGDEVLPLAGRWNLGEGRVLAVAFGPPQATAEKLGALVAQSPRDPRYRVSWEVGTDLRVSVDAVEGGRFLNGQRLALHLLDAEGSAVSRELAVPQIAPGKYELSIPSPRSPALATVRAGGQVIARRALAGRYAPEFETLGNDHQAMEKLAERSGGQVVPPTRAQPLKIRFPSRPVSLASPLAVAGAALILLALVWWRWR